jgi:hypothetical protein
MRRTTASMSSVNHYLTISGAFRLETNSPDALVLGGNVTDMSQR